MRQFGDAQLELGEEEDGDGALEGGVHSPLKFYNLERLVAFQFAAAQDSQVLLKLQQH